VKTATGRQLQADGAASGFKFVSAAGTEVAVEVNIARQVLGEGRRITGDVGDGRASVTITNYQGEIKFFRR